MRGRMSVLSTYRHSLCSVPMNRLTKGLSFGERGRVQYCVMPSDARYSGTSPMFSLLLSFTSANPEPNLATAFLAHSLALRLDGLDATCTTGSFACTSIAQKA